MKKLFFLVTFFLSTFSFASSRLSAAQGIVEYKVTKATYSSVHVKNASRAQLILNFDKSVVEFNIQIAFRCPDDRICAQIMPLPVQIELPIISVKTDRCGVRIVEAQLDNQDADGELQKIEIVDPSQSSCESLLIVKPKATYTTKYIDHQNGKSIINQSKMLLKLQFVHGVSETQP